jgi:SAM-dependent methyltransferase
MSEPDETSAAFGQIYRDHSWGGVSRSGVGSSQEAARAYADTVTSVMQRFDVGTVLDLGCGDWEFSRRIDWGGARYIGVDIVPELVEHLRATFGGPNVEFLQGNLLDADLPDADLVLCKDVLQHLGTAQVERALDRLSRYPLVMLTNDRVLRTRLGWRHLWRTTETGTPNVDIPPGGWRPLLLREPPFGLTAEEACRYTVRSGDRTWVKEVLLWRGQRQRPA